MALIELAIKCALALESQFSGGKGNAKKWCSGALSPHQRHDSQVLVGAEKNFNKSQCAGESDKTMDSLAALQLVVRRPILAMAGYAVERSQPVEEC